MAFTASGLVPTPSGAIREEVTHFSLNYTFWLNVAFGALAVWLFVLDARHAGRHEHVHAAADAGHDHGPAHRHPH